MGIIGDISTVIAWWIHLFSKGFFITFGIGIGLISLFFITNLLIGV